MKARPRIAPWVGVAGLLILMAMRVEAAEQRYQLLLDTDNNAATGCVVSIGGSSAAGVEQVLTTVVNTTTTGVNVVRVERQTCTAGVLDAAVTYSAGGWAVGLGNGVGGASVVESYVPLASLPTGTFKAWGVGIDSNGASDWTAPFFITVAAGGPASAPTPIPLSPWILLPLALGLFGIAVWSRRKYPPSMPMLALVVMVAATGIAWASTVILDGNIGDWAGINAAVTDPQGDAPPNADIVGIYYQQDAQNLYLRFDTGVQKDVPGNQAPIVNAGPDQTITLPAVANLAGTASDDGLPNPPGVLTTTWSFVSGPGTVVFGNVHALATTATFTVAGTYVLRLTASDSALSASDTMQVTVASAPPGNQPPVVNAGPDQTITLPAVANLAGSASDDGLPNPPGVLTTTWSFVSGPGSVVFGNVHALSTTAAFTVAGTYVLRLTASDSALSTSDTMQVTVASVPPGNQAPVVNAGPDQTITLPAVANLAGTASDDGLPNPPGVLTTTWSTASGPGSVVFGNVHSLSTTATFTVAGTYVLRLTADDSALSTSSTLTITVNDMAGGAPALAPIANQTIALGNRFQQLLQATSPNVNETLTLALPTAPAGATLNPAPLIDWTPTVGELGPNIFTATVTDSHGLTATVTFTVTVTHVNQPPQLAPQADESVRIGTTFTRLLKATDPDAGDTLTFALVAGPSGMALNGATLTWPTGSTAVGDYAVTVKVTDGGGLFDTQSFTIKLLPVVSPVAVDDNYNVRLGDTLTVPAPGVLANDLASGGATLTAVKISDPDKGTLNAFNADGSFVYAAPAVAAGPVFAPTLKWNNAVPFWFGNANPVVADVFANGKPVVFASRHNNEGGITAIDGATGTTIWTVTGELPSPNAGCYIQVDVTPENQQADNLAVGDIDDSGVPAIVTSAKCLADGAQATRMVALNARTGAVKWLTPPLGAFIINSNGFNFFFDMTYGITPVIARLHPAETPSVLFKVDAESFLDNASTQRSCDQFQANSGLTWCTGIMVLNGADGSVRHRFIAPNDPAGRENFAAGHLMVADLTGSGTLNLIANGAVWDADGNLISNRLGVLPLSIALANLDDSGQVSIVSYEFTGSAFIVARHADGTVLWKTPIDSTFTHGLLSVADLDGDGSPEIMTTAGGNLYVYGANGQIKWSHRYADASDMPTIDVGKRPAAFDLDGDGIAEVIIPTTFGVEFTDGATGKTKKTLTWADLGVTNTGYGGGYAPAYSSSAVVADIDGSGHASILVTIPGYVFGSSQYVVAIGATNNDWRPAPTVFNQFSYHFSNVDNIGHIPTVEIDNFATPRTNVYGNQPQTQIPIDPRVFQGTTFTYAASDGTQTSQPATVTIDIQPQNRPPVFTSVAPTVYVPFGVLTYAAHATDPDPGDVVTYSMLLTSGNGASSCNVNASSGLVTCSSLALGDQFFTIVATDTQGASAFQSVHLVQSAGPATVPNVIGQSKSGADATLTAAGFVTGIVSSIYYAAPANQVLTQFPAAGATALTGSAIALQVSLGPQPQAVPDVVGLQLSDARQRLTGFGFGIIVIPVASATAPAGEVVAQDPAFGTTLAPPSPVTISVSIGPPLTGTVAQVIVQPAPTALRVTGESLNFTATAVFTDGTSADVTIASLWDTSAPTVASVDSTGSAKALTPGMSTISAKAGGVTGQSALTVVARNTGDNVTPVAQITSPADGASVSSPTTVTGTASDANFLRYELAVAAAGDTSWTMISEGTTAVTAGTLGMLDPTTLLNDLYTLRLTVFDTNSNLTVATSTVQVTGGQKPGLFTLTYQDLNIPASGIPIAVTRTYDSRDKTQGDFGIGWKLGFQTLRLRTNRVPGTGWVRQNSGVTVSLTATSEHKVSLTLPDGHVEEFDLQLSPTSGIGGLDETVVTGYAARAGTLGKLEMLDNANLLILGAGPEDELVDDTTLNTFQPVHYRYTAINGTQFEIDSTTGVTKITDRNANSVTLGPNGIIHSSGQSVVFLRDSQNRITQITDPAGNVQTFAYDGNGDLANHATATNAVSHYRYDRNHDLIDIQDPAGNHASRNTYDASGHLIATTDANGNTLTFANDQAASRQLVTDQLGNPTTYDYDTMGNVVAKTDALGNVTTYTYDSRNNQLTQIDPLGRVATKTYDTNNNVLTDTDFDGNTTTSTYNAFGQPLTRIDPEGRTTVNVYDGSGNQIQVTDPEGAITLHTYDGMGHVLATTDPLERVTTFVYDSSGNQISKTDPLGQITTYTYDSNGHRLREIDAAGKMTLFAYDADGHVIASTDKLGNVTTKTYNNVGLGVRISSTSDAVGNMTRFAYDAIGNLTQTAYPDGSAATTAFDADNRQTSSTDPDGRITRFEYDALGRATKTTLPDGGARLSSYDTVGRVLTRTDQRGYTTSWVYAPNRRTITDPLGDVVTIDFDSYGRPLRRTDALGHVTSFVYDSASKLVRTNYPDGTAKSTSYDAAKQRIAEIDQAGVTTSFTYDAASQLTSVTDALGGITRYTYDVVGNRVTITDANGHVTQMTYDALGSMVTRTRSSGVTESFVYDAVANQVAHTDFNGQSTTLTYDKLQRLTQKALPNGTNVGYAYTTAGLRTRAGGDTYVYDASGRLILENKASGQALSYGYDLAGNRISLTTPQATVNYTFDALNRLKTAVDGTGATAYSYDPAGRKIAAAYPNGVTATYGYDALNRLVQVANTGPGGLISSYTYSLGPTGNRIQVAEAGSATTGRVVAYAYDVDYRLTQEQIAEAGTTILTVSYSLDKVGNRTQMVRNGVTTNYSYNSNDALISQTSGSSTVNSTFDNNGNLVGSNFGAATQTNVYDAENRLVSANGPAGNFSYTYDADGTRTGRTVSGVTTSFLVDKNRDPSQVIAEGSGANVLTYTYGDQVINQQQSGVGSHFYLADGQQSVRQLATASGVVSDSYTYDAFGVPLDSTGATTNAYRYAGEQEEPDTGNYYLRARYVEPTTGRFTTTDPHDGSPFDPKSETRYIYAGANPIDNRDPTGQDTLVNIVGTLIVVGILDDALIFPLVGAKTATQKSAVFAGQAAFVVGVFLIPGVLAAAPAAVVVTTVTTVTTVAEGGTVALGTVEGIAYTYEAFLTALRLRQAASAGRAMIAAFLALNPGARCSAIRGLIELGPDLVEDMFPGQDNGQFLTVVQDYMNQIGGQFGC